MVGATRNALLVLALSLLPSLASGDDKRVLVGFAAVVENLIPDLRYEYCDAGCSGHSYLNLSWPIQLDVQHVDLHPRIALLNAPFIEPQWVKDSETRFLAGDRLSLLWRIGENRFLGLFLEGAGILAADNYGGLIGSGVSLLTKPKLGIGFSLVYRRSFTQEQRRHDISLGLDLPLAIFWRWR
jgi:hypothetical protein